MRVAFTALMALALPWAAMATTYVVHPDGTGDFPTIQAAINAAIDGDVIELTDGTFTGVGNRDVDYLGKGVTVRSQSGDPATCVIDCQQAGRGVFFHSGEPPEAVLEGVTITGGRAGAGGGVLLTIAARPVVRGCRIVGNVATGSGGGICCIGVGASAWEVDVADCTIAGNEADLGGGIFTEGVGVPLAVSLTRCVVTGNNGTYGGGMHCVYSIVSFTGCTFSANHADMGGGALATSLTGLTIERCVLWGDCADLDGGELWLDYGSHAELYCCVVDSSGVGGAETPIYDANTIFVNPLFCDPADCMSLPTIAGDYHVDAVSMCLPSASPCGELIGALGQGCGGTVPARERSWGGIKGLFRR